MGIKNQIMRGMGAVNQYGVAGTFRKATEKFHAPENRYKKNWQRYLPDEAELERQRAEGFTYEPKVSLVVPAFETDAFFLKELLISVMNQTYQNWELIVADGSSSSKVEDFISEYIVKEPERICYKRLEENGGISQNTNAGFLFATGEYIGLIDHDDKLAPNALFEMVKKINECPQKDRDHLLCYSDEDKINADSTMHMQVHFKPDYNEELIRHYNYICHFLVFHESFLERIGNLDGEKNGAQDYDFILRCILDGAKVVHIPKVLYHWRVHEASTAGAASSKNYAYKAGVHALCNYLEKKEIQAVVTISKDLGIYDVDYGKLEHEKISIVPVLNNDAIKNAPGEYIAYTSPHVQSAPNGWQEILGNMCAQEDVAMVGSKSVKENKVSQCGLIYKEDGQVLPAFRGLAKEYRGYFNRARLPQDVSLLSPNAVLILKKEAWQQVGGIDESLCFPYREMDFSFRLKKAGYRVVLAANLVAMVGSEGGCGKGFTVTNEQKEESKREFMKRWGEWLKAYDPSYNPNLSYLQGGYTLKV